MSVWRVIGTETEYGISVPGNPGANAMLISSQVVNAYSQPSSSRSRRARWDFEEESPLRDARGFDLARDVADASQLTDEDVGLANVILTNGARFYVDHAHPEFSSPECTNPRDAVIWDKAGERIMAEASRRAAQTVPGQPPIQLYKNNTDNKGQSYGSHENYLMSRATPFADIVRHLTPFFVSRQVVAGQGRVGIGQDGRGEGFQLSQRADFFEEEVGLEVFRAERAAEVEAAGVAQRRLLLEVPPGPAVAGHVRPAAVPVDDLRRQQHRVGTRLARHGHPVLDLRAHHPADRHGLKPTAAVESA